MQPSSDPPAQDTGSGNLRYECGVCWAVYDPAEGDDYAQVRAGTPFSQLPSHWACPNCDAPKARFMAVDA
jgi:rubredoxin